MKYTDVIKHEYIDKYVEMQKALFLDFNRIVFDIAFLQKALANRELSMLYDTYFVIEKLFHNVFQHLIIKISRCLFDTGSDTITLPRFKNHIIRTFIKEEYKQAVLEIVHSSRWNSVETKNLISQVKESTAGFRNHFLAHILEGELGDLTVSLDDIATIFNAATDLFTALSFETSDLYYPTPTDGCTFVDEQRAVSEFCDHFFDYQYLSSPHIEYINYQLDEFLIDPSEKSTIEQRIFAINERKKGK